MNKFSLIEIQLANAFPQFSDCFSIDTRSEFSVIDYKGQSYLVNDNNEITMKGVYYYARQYGFG